MASHPVRRSFRFIQSPSHSIWPFRPNALLPLRQRQSRSFNTSERSQAVVAAQEIDFDDVGAPINQIPARMIPASRSYFTASPEFNDSIIRLRTLLQKFEYLPTVEHDQAPRRRWLKLGQYRSTSGEPVSAARYARVLRLLQRLNRIDPHLVPPQIEEILTQFLRPSSGDTGTGGFRSLDRLGRARAIGRRKESTSVVMLVEGNGQVLVNGRSLVEVFPRMHDRESALWALKISNRLDKYNVWAVTKGGGVTGQAESITLALGKALLIHEPALKPILRRGEFINSFHLSGRIFILSEMTNSEPYAEKYRGHFSLLLSP